MQRDFFLVRQPRNMFAAVSQVICSQLKADYYKRLVRRSQKYAKHVEMFFLLLHETNFSCFIFTLFYSRSSNLGSRWNHLHEKKYELWNVCRQLSCRYFFLARQLWNELVVVLWVVCNWHDKLFGSSTSSVWLPRVFNCLYSFFSYIGSQYVHQDYLPVWLLSRYV